MGEKIKNISNINYIIKGMLISIVITFVSLVVLSAILTYTDVSENISNSAIIVINGISILIGSSIAIRKQKSKGLLKGGLLGLLYIAIIYLISSLISLDFSLDLNSILMIVFSIVAGIVGGVIGVNLKTN